MSWSSSSVGGFARNVMAYSAHLGAAQVLRGTSCTEPREAPTLLSAPQTRLATLTLRADVAELVDAHGSVPCGLRLVEVQSSHPHSPTRPGWRCSFLGGGDGDCLEEGLLRLGLFAGGGDPPQSRQREIVRVAVLAEPGALACEGLLHVFVDVAQGFQQRGADRPAANALRRRPPRRCAAVPLQ